ncbi:MAG: hypothetical protein EXS42_07720 [Lacunisphaera sp.]|nr:hypothetical protein [Lacunisphaera sp.]
MNDADVVAFRADLKSGGSGIFTGSGGAVTTIADTHDLLSGFEGLPVISRQGRVVFRADRGDGGKGVYVGSGGSFVPIAETGDRFRNFASFPSINDQETVAFGATLNAGGAGVFTATAGTLTTVIDGSGPFESFRGALINNAGTVVFAATPRSGKLGIYAGPDPVADKVIAMGDLFLGSTIAGFALNPVSVNAAGQMVIRIKLADDRQMIVQVE